MRQIFLAEDLLESNTRMKTIFIKCWFSPSTVRGFSGDIKIPSGRMPTPRAFLKAHPDPGVLAQNPLAITRMFYINLALEEGIFRLL